MMIAFTVEERQELRLAIRSALTDLSMGCNARAILRGAYVKLARSDGVSECLIVGGPTVPLSPRDGMQRIGELTEMVIESVRRELDEEHQHTERAAAALGDHMAAIETRNG